MVPQPELSQRVMANVSSSPSQHTDLYDPPFVAGCVIVHGIHAWCPCLWLESSLDEVVI